MSIQPPPPPTQGKSDKQPTPPTTNTSTTEKKQEEQAVLKLPSIPVAKEQQLRQIDGGRTLQRLRHIQQKYTFIPPTEMYLLVNPAEVYATALYYFAQKARLFEKCRNIIVLLPLLTTWLGLSIASGAYSQAIFDQPKLIAQPFLKLWIDGFPTVTHLYIASIFIAPSVIHFLSFSNVAGWDALLFFALIWLTYYVQKEDTQASNKAQDLTTWLQEYLFTVEIHSRTVRTEGNGRDLSLDRFSDHFSELVMEMQKVIATFNSAVQQQADGQKELIKGTSRVATAATRMDIIFTKGEETYTRLDKALAKLEEQFKTMASGQSGVADSLDQIAKGIHKSATAIDELARPFAAEDLGSIAHRIGQQQQEGMKDFSQILRQQEEVAVLMGDVLNKISTLPTQPQQRHWWTRLYNRIRSRDNN